METSKYSTKKEWGREGRNEGGVKFSFALSSSSPLQTQKGNFLEGINFVSARHFGSGRLKMTFPSFFNFDADAGGPSPTGALFWDCYFPIIFAPIENES